MAQESNEMIEAETPQDLPQQAPAVQPEAAADESQTTQRDLQRSALSDLVELARQSAATEAEIERRYHDSVEEENKAHERSAKNLGYRLDSLKDQVAQKHQEQLAKLTAQFQADESTLRQGGIASRRRVEEECENIRQDIGQQVDKAVWLADSVLEGEQNQFRAEGKKAEQELEANLDLLDAQERQIAALLETYHYRPAVEPADSEDQSEEIAGDVEAEFVRRREAVAAGLGHLKRLWAPWLFVGARPVLLLVLALLAAAVIAQVRTAGLPQDWGNPQLNWKAINPALAGTAGGCAVLGVILWFVGQSQVRKTYLPLRQAVKSARRGARARLDHSLKQLAQRNSQALHRRNAEVQTTRDRYAPTLARAQRNRETSLATMECERLKQLTRLSAQRDAGKAKADEWKRGHLNDLQKRYEHELAAVGQQHQQKLAQFLKDYEQGRASLQRRLEEGLHHIQAPIERIRSDGQMMPWTDPAWRDWRPPRRFSQIVRFGELAVDLKKIAAQVPRNTPQQLALPEGFTMPASLGFPNQASLLIQGDRSVREQAIRTLQMVMTRLLTVLPPGRVRFTIIDPVALGQNFAGFMHLADHDEALVGGRIWTEQDHIERRLADLTEHMETVIQKYLRNEFATIDDYNAQAGELAEPYRFLVISDLPASFSGEACRRLASIAASGARCGVYTLIYRDARQSLPSELNIEELEHKSVNLVQEGGTLVWKDQVFEQFPLTLDESPPEEALTRILDAVGRAAKEAKRVEVPFETIAPEPDKMWSGSSRSDVLVPIGKMGATRLQALRLGRGVAQHALIAGKTGSGKSTLLHVLITNLALWYSPDEIEFYLVDFKKGVEFKTYASHALPHARAIAVESDREFGLSVLHRLDGELARRGELFRKAGVQDLPSYRQMPGSPKMPRTLLVIDEFQEFFSEDDKIAQDAAVLLDRLVRQGRAFGIHVLLGSQTIGGSSGLARSTIGQMAVRIALQCSEADSQLILGDNNAAARLLSRPGEAIYNDAGGLVESNSPFQISWLPDEQRDRLLEQVEARSKAAGDGRPEPIVFEGNAPADLRKNALLAAMLTGPARAASSAPRAFLGEPVAIKEPTGVTFRRQSGANLLIVGQQEESAMALMESSVLSLAAQQGKDKTEFWVFDGSPADSPLSGRFARLRDALPHQFNLVEWRATPEAMHQLAEQMQKRQGGEEGGPTIYVIIYGLQRYRVLRKQEESFSFSAGDEEKRSQPDKEFTDLLREGPALGMHVLAWCDTPIAVERTLDRNALREFDNRVLFQMSAGDSSNLIDSPAANKLGFYRALAYSEEQGMMEKFRPYALVDRDFLTRAAALLRGK